MSALREAEVRVPTGVDDAWSGAEFVQVLAALARHDRDGRVFDLKLDYRVGEWLTYGFAPLLASAGGGLARLDSPANVRALQELARWRGYVEPDADGKAFTSRRVALSWVGHWTYADYRSALGKDLVLLPLPDLGEGSRTGSGSWAWAISRATSHRPVAGRLLEHLARTRRSAAPVCRQRAAGQAVPRPVTPDYPAITSAFSTAVHRVLTGTRPSTALAEAAAQTAQP